MNMTLCLFKDLLSTVVGACEHIVLVTHSVRCYNNVFIITSITQWHIQI